MARYRKGFNDINAHVNRTNNPEELFDLTMNNLLDGFYDYALDSSSEGIFKAVCLSGFKFEDNSGSGPEDVFLQAQGVEVGEFMSIIVRPLQNFASGTPDPTKAKDPNQLIRFLAAHKVFTAVHDNGETPPSIPQFGELVDCYYEEGSVGKSDYGLLRWMPTDPAMPPVAEYRALQLMEGTRAAADAFSRGTVAVLGGAPLTTDIPELTGDLVPIKTWHAVGHWKEDGTFSKGECPDALTGAFSSLPRKVTTFYNYKAEDVINAIFNCGQPEHVQKTMWCFSRKEQPSFSYPNNNVAGIQTDGPMFGGTTVADYDYHTCFKDSKTWRGFAGFNNLTRGMIIFGRIVASKYTRKFRKLEGTYEEQAETLVWNYYRGWNLAATPTELDTLKATGAFTRGGDTYKRDWNKDKAWFKKQMEYFDSVVSTSSSGS